MATGHALQHQAGFQRIGGHHEGLARGLERLGADPVDWTSFCVIRNPWDAIVSWHVGGSGAPGPLTVERIREIMEGVTGDYVPDPHRLWSLHGDADHRLRYEHLEGELNELLSRFDLGPVELPRRNVSDARQGRPYHSFYTSLSRRFVEGLFYVETQELGYTY